MDKMWDVVGEAAADIVSHSCSRMIRKKVSEIEQETAMRIAIPVEDISVEGKVCPSFGRAPYFYLYDTEDGHTLFLQNSAAESQGGAGIKAAQLLVDNQVAVVLAPRCGENSAKVLHSANMHIYKTVSSGVSENLALFAQGKLALLDKFHAGFLGHAE